MPFLGQIHEIRLAHGTAWFLLTWIIITTSATICVAAMVGQAAMPKRQMATRRPINLILTWRQVGTLKAVAFLTALTIFLTTYIAMILVWEDFSYYDNSYFTQFTLKGHNSPLTIWPAIGRFFPLYDQEFNLITRHFTHSIIGYYLLPIAQLLVFFSILVILDTELSITTRVALVILALLTPSILTSFSALVFPERNVLFYLVCLMLFVKQFEQTRSIAWAVAATVSAQIMLYYKETAFLLLSGFAVGRLILRCRNAYDAGWDYDRLWDSESRLDVCFVLLSLLFVVYYFANMDIQEDMYYLTTRFRRTEVALGYLRLDLLAWLFMAVVLGRVYLILRRRVIPLLLWDGLAFGGVCCFIAYLYLPIFGIYFLAPVDLIAVLYVGRFAVLSWSKIRSWGKIAAVLLASIVLLQNVVGSAFAVFERKNVIHGKAEIASVVETQYPNGAGNHLRLFFPFAGGYVINEFASYLDYRGVSLEEVVDEVGARNSVVLAARAIAKDGPCVEWSRIRCHAARGPAPGDLVIVLPDDDVSAEEASVYREPGELLFSYEPTPLIPHWLHSLFGSLHVATTRLWPDRKIPDRWMDGSVARWK
jgi:hypothetical protein